MNVKPAFGWGLLLKGGKPFLLNRLFGYRADAIDHYDSIYRKPGTYLRHRKAGTVLAVRVKMAPAFTKRFKEICDD